MTTMLRKLSEVLASADMRMQSRRRRRSAQRKLKKLEPPYSLNVGCGHVGFDGWINVDLDSAAKAADILVDVTDGIPVADESCQFIYNEHFLEHLTVEDGLCFLNECHRILRPGGVLRVAMPSVSEPVRQYYEDDWRDQPWMKKHGFTHIQTRAELINIAFRNWGINGFTTGKSCIVDSKKQVSNKLQMSSGGRAITRNSGGVRRVRRHVLSARRQGSELWPVRWIGEWCMSNRSTQEPERQLGSPASRNPVNLPTALQKEFVFIIGSDRSGTTWLQSMVGAHPRVASTVQLTLFHTYIPAWIEFWKEDEELIADSRQWDMGLPVVWSKDDLQGFLREFAARVYERVLDRNPDATHVLDKHPAYREHTADIDWIIPHARFIHVIRDGRDVALSLMAAKEGLGWGFSTLSEAAMHWRQFVEVARKAEQYDGRYLEVRYEDLHTNGPQTLKTVFEFCNLDLSDEDVEQIVQQHSFDKMKSKSASPDSRHKAPASHYRSGRVGSWQNVFSNTDRYVFERHAGPTLRELGYADEDWWYSNRWQGHKLKIQETSRGIGRRLKRAWLALRGR